jgi:hypothetical protein
MDLDSYVKQDLREHLLTKDYKQLSFTDMNNRMNNIRSRLKDIITNNQDMLSKAEVIYFQRSLKSHFRLPIFYGLPKVHKNTMSLRPVVSSTNSLLAVFSVWLDYKSKELLPLIKSYLKDSNTLIKCLKGIHIPENALVFTADAKSMYTNINTKTGIDTIANFLLVNERLLPPNFPSNLFLKNNIFSFADTYWLQLCGTAMGTPVACAYATITYGHFEKTMILPNCSANLLFYRRYINDIFGIWLLSPNNTITWRNFKSDLNKWGNLEWSIEEPSRQTHFLDLNISIVESSISFSTYQKPLNL